MLGKGGMANLMKQAQQMQGKMQEMQAQLKTLTATGESGGGWVKVTLDGDHQMTRLEIDDKLMDDKEMLEDLIMAAHSQAKEKIAEAIQQKTEEVTGGMGLPAGMKFPF